MTTLKLLIVEDEPLYATELEMLAFKLGYEKIHSTGNSEEALHMIKVMDPDLIIMDIKIDGPYNGVEVAELIKAQQIPIIFITSGRDKTLYERAKKTGSVAYLIKPFDELTLQSAIEFAMEKLVKQQTDPEDYKGWSADQLIKNNLLIKKHNSLHKLPISEIAYIQSDGNYCTIHALQNEKHLVNLSLTRLQDMLPAKKFFRVHKRYVVQLDLIQDITSGVTELVISNHAIPIGRTYRKALLQHFNIIG